MTPLSDAEFARRQTVWTAFSEFWLDTELEEFDLRHTAKVAAASGYDLQELREIYLFEVAPLVYTNMFSMAGEWAGFPEEWLHAEARKRADRRGAWLRFWVAIGLGKFLMTWGTERHWRRIVALMAESNGPRDDEASL